MERGACAPIFFLLKLFQVGAIRYDPCKAVSQAKQLMRNEFGRAGLSLQRPKYHGA
jgi:hypothetical protein